MNNSIRFRRITAISAIASIPITIASTILLFWAVDFNVELISDPTGLILLGAERARIFRWGSFLELGAPTLLFVPAAIYLWSWLKSRNSSLITMYTAFGLIGIIMSAVASTVRATLFPPIMSAYPVATEAESETLLIVFKAVIAFVFEGLYALESVFWGLWWIGIGSELYGERKRLGLFTAALGIALLGTGLGWMLQIDPLARLESAFFLMPIWAIWFAIVVLQHSRQSEMGPKPA